MFENCLNCPIFEVCAKKYDDFADFCDGPIQDEQDENKDERGKK